MNSFQTEVDPLFGIIVVVVIGLVAAFAILQAADISNWGTFVNALKTPDLSDLPQ